MPFIRDAIDRKQENMRRRRRRDALRLQLVRVFDVIARQGTLARARGGAGGSGGVTETEAKGSGLVRDRQTDRQTERERVFRLSDRE